MLNRERFLGELPGDPWDILIIGGGATGLGSALDAASRGYRTLLLEATDFAQGTSSRSTKLIHGGVRYLRQGNVSLVRESLHERGLLLRNAPGLVHPLEFIIPTGSFLESAYYAVGLKAYDFLAGRQGLARSRMLSLAQVQGKVPTIRRDVVQGGVSYADAQFDDARLAIAIAQAAVREGAMVLNRFPVTGLVKTQGKVKGVVARDAESGREYQIAARVVVNATGAFTDRIREFDEPHHKLALCPSQGVHLTLDRSFLPGDAAIIVPKTDDSRVLFLIPWEGAVLVGTTDTPVNGPVEHPQARAEEIDYLLRYAREYLVRAPERRDIRSTFVGVRPLVKVGNDTTVTSRLSRDHVVSRSDSGLVSVTGGKWTTYRKMALDTVNAAAEVADLPERPCRTENLPLQTADEVTAPTEEPLSDARIQHYVRAEMARGLEDVLARRTRLLMVDARRAWAAGPRVARLLATELGKDDLWVQQELNNLEQSVRAALPADAPLD